MSTGSGASSASLTNYAIPQQNGGYAAQSNQAYTGQMYDEESDACQPAT